MTGRASRSSPTRRPELTYQRNSACGRHGWLRLTPAYSIDLVDGILARTTGPLVVLDPFSGTGTTALCAAARGHLATAIDINPFLVWFGNAKTATYRLRDLKDASEAAADALRMNDSVDPPPIFNITRWWNARPLAFLCRLMGGIQAVAPEEGPLRNLLLVAFCRTMMHLSNAAFNHQSMSFRSSTRAFAPESPCGPEEQARAHERQFHDDLVFVLAGAADNPKAPARVHLADARSTPPSDGGPIDLLITSPPYPNRMSYIRELRPYMYWLGHIQEARQAGELDWRAIGGTWGIATSRVAAWTKDDATYFPPYLPVILEKIRRSDARSGEVLARYVGKYFEDMWQHLVSVLQVMRSGGELRYIVGNSKFYDVLVPVEMVYRDMLRCAGVSQVKVIPIRKRNSKKELIEYEVAATR